MFQKISFPSNHNKISGVLSLPDKYTTGVVFLHGGGKANLKRYEYLQKVFHKKGIASLVFDFMGCGESEGKFEDGSLNQRIRSAHGATNFFLKRTNLTTKDIYLWGSSMGAHVACRLLEDLQVKGVILQSAAAYNKEAESKKFNEEFTSAIQKPITWEKSPAFKALETFNGKILVVYGENDSLIPTGVRDKYKQIANNNNGKFVVLKNGVHTLLRPSCPEEREALIKLGKVSSAYILSL